MRAGTSEVPILKNGQTDEGYNDAIRVPAEAYARINGVGELGGAKGAIRRAHAAVSGVDDSDAEVEVNRQHSRPTEPNTETKEGIGL